MIRERQDMTDDPLMFALELTRQDNKKVNSYIDDVLGSADIIGDDIRQRQQRIRDSNESKSIAYRNIQPRTPGAPSICARLQYQRLSSDGADAAQNFLSQAKDRNREMGSYPARAEAM